MTKLTTNSKDSEHTFVSINEIHNTKVEGHITCIELTAQQIILENGKQIAQQTIIVEIPTLELVQTFNTTWTNNAIGKLKQWINQLSK